MLFLHCLLIIIGFLLNESSSNPIVAYSISESSEKSTLEDQLQSIFERSQYCNQSFQCCNEQKPECISPWTYCDNGTCKCGEIPSDIVQCHLDTNSTILPRQCITYDDITQANVIGSCLYHKGTDKMDLILPRNVTLLTKKLCGPFNRTGTLCGKCKDGHYPLAYSYDMNCVECPDGKSNWWKFVLAAFLPLTVFYFIILFFEINVTSSHLHGFVFCSQGVTVPALARGILLPVRNKIEINTAIRCIGSFFGIWNLDFLRFIDLGICLPTNTLTILALDVAVGIYPLLLIILTYILIQFYDRRVKLIVTIWKPFGAVFSLFRQNWEINTSLIDAFTTFLLLSSVKFLSVSYDLLVPTRVYQLNPTTGNLTQSWRLYYDPTVPYFGKQHLPYAILAISVLTIFVILPAALLLLYPFRCFQKFLNLFPVRWYILHTFMDSFQGCYKDGTQPGTRDCRWFVLVFYMARICYLVVGVLYVTLNVLFYPTMSILLILIAILVITVQPYKAAVSHYSDINAIFFLFLAMWYVSIFGLSSSGLNALRAKYPLIGIALSVPLLGLLYMLGIILRWVYIHRKFGENIIKRLQAWRHGYIALAQR